MARSRREPLPAKEKAKSAPVGKARKSTRVEGALKRKKRRHESFHYFIFKVLRSVHPKLGISKKAMIVMESFVMDMFEKLAREAANLVKVGKTRTLSARDLQTAARLILGGELAKHAVSEGTKAVTKYITSKNG